MKKLFLFAALAAMMVGCSETDELALNQVAQQTEKGGIQFDVYTHRAITRAGVPGGIENGKYGVTTASLKTGNHAAAGFGVFAYYTSNSEYDNNSSTPNFMYNEQVTWSDKENGGNDTWTYEPVKYWPNEFGNSAESDDFDHVTFFAYAPWTKFTYNTGIPTINPDDLLEGETESEQAARQQKKNITGTVKNSASGDPYIKYVVDTDPATSVDLLWGVAAELNGYEGINKGAVEPGNCYIDLTKQIGTTDSVKWNFKHALAQINIQIIQAVDTETEGSEIYEPADDAVAISTNADGTVDKKTKVYLRWIEFNGFSMKGALNLHSEEAKNVADAKPNWKGYDGTNELTYEPVRFYDGLKDGKEGTTNNIQKNENPLGLNPDLLEEPTGENWADKKIGIPYAEYANLFATTKYDEKTDARVAAPANASDPIYVIPNDEELTIEMLYDVQTEDKHLAATLSDAKTHGIAVENKISKNTGVTIEAGKSYVIKIVVGMESVKFTVEVTDWDPEVAPETDVDMPYNPGYKLFGALYGYVDADANNETDNQYTTLAGTYNLFEKLFPNDDEIAANGSRMTRADEVAESMKYYYFAYDASSGKFLKRVLKEGFQLETPMDFETYSETEGEDTWTTESYKMAFYKELLGDDEAATFCTLTVSAGNGGGTTTVPEGKDFVQGTEITVTATPDQGYKFVNWTDGDNNIVSTEAAYTFTIQEATTLTANFAEIVNYTVKVAASGNGTVTNSGENSIEEGVSFSSTANPSNEDYELKGWYNTADLENESPTALSTNKTYSISAVDKDYDITAVFHGKSLQTGKAYDFTSATNFSVSTVTVNTFTSQGSTNFYRFRINATGRPEYRYIRKTDFDNARIGSELNFYTQPQTSASSTGTITITGTPNN